jgi:RNA recognition motif-containing protein
LYVKNLNEKIKKDGRLLNQRFAVKSENDINLDMQHSLFHLFSLYGDILEILIKKNLKMKGQAFITFSSAEPATKAMHDLQNYNFFGKKMVRATNKNRKSNLLKNSRTVRQRPRENSINSRLNKRYQEKKQEEAKQRKEKREEMKQELKQLKGDVEHIESKIKHKQEEDMQKEVDETKIALTVENLPSVADESFLRPIFEG